jgi:hypothetical protein
MSKLLIIDKPSSCIHRRIVSEAGDEMTICDVKVHKGKYLQCGSSFNFPELCPLTDTTKNQEKGK